MRRLDGDRLRGAVFGPLSHAPDRIRFASPSCCRARVQCAPAWGAALKRPSMTKPNAPNRGGGNRVWGICNGPPAHEPFGWAEAVGGVAATALTLTEKAEVRTA